MQQALRFGGIDDEYDFMCECSDARCQERLTLTLRDYEHIRAEGTRFVIVPGHVRHELEVVVETSEHHVIVEKDGVAGLLADFADPRDATTPSDFEK